MGAHDGRPPCVCVGALGVRVPCVKCVPCGRGAPVTAPSPLPCFGSVSVPTQHGCQCIILRPIFSGFHLQTGPQGRSVVSDAERRPPAAQLGTWGWLTQALAQRHPTLWLPGAALEGELSGATHKANANSSR